MTIEKYMSEYNINPMETAKDEGLLSVEMCKSKILNLIELNIRNFKNNTWNLRNRMNKLLVDLSPEKNKSVFTIRLGGKRVYRCHCQRLELTQKIDFLNKFFQAVSQGYLDQAIINFCEDEVKRSMKRKNDLKERRKAKRDAEKAAYKEREAEAIRHLPRTI